MKVIVNRILYIIFPYFVQSIVPCPLCMVGSLGGLSSSPESLDEAESRGGSGSLSLRAITHVGGRGCFSAPRGFHSAITGQDAELPSVQFGIGSAETVS